MFCFFLRVIPLVFQAYFSIVIMIASVFIIYAWAPAIHNNHYIDKPDLIYYGKLSRIIIMLETFVVAIGYIAGLSQFSFAFSLGILAETFSIIATKIKRMKRKERK